MFHSLVFISYSRKDETYKNALFDHLKGLQNQVGFELWTDDRIGGGKIWKQEIEQAIKQAKVAILVVTRNFLSSEFVQKVEIPNLLQQREREGLVIFPIIARHCVWQKVRWLAEIQVRPKNGRPIWVNEQSQVDEDLTAIAEEIANILEIDSILPKEQVYTWQRQRSQLEETPEYKIILEVIDLLQQLNIILDQDLIVRLARDWMDDIPRTQIEQALNELKKVTIIEDIEAQPLQPKSHYLQNNEAGRQFLKVLDDFRHRIVSDSFFEGLLHMCISNSIEIEIAAKLWNFLGRISIELGEDVAFNRGVARSQQGHQLNLEAIKDFFTALQKYPHLASRILEPPPIQYVSRSDLEQTFKAVGDIVTAYIFLCQEGLKHSPYTSPKYAELIVSIAEQAEDLARDKIETRKNYVVVLDELDQDPLSTLLNDLDTLIKATGYQDADLLYRSAKRRYTSRHNLAEIKFKEKQEELKFELNEAQNFLREEQKQLEDRLKAELDEARKNFNLLEKEQRQLESELDEARKNFNLLEKEQRQLESELNSCKDEQERLEWEWREAQKELNLFLEKQEQSEVKLKSLKAEQERSAIALDKAREKSYPLLKKQRQLDIELNKAKNDLSPLKEGQIKLDEARKNLNLLEEDQKRLEVELDEARKNLNLLEEDQKRLEVELGEPQNYSDSSTAWSASTEYIKGAWEEVMRVKKNIEELSIESFVLDELRRASRDARRAHQLNPTQKYSKLVDEISQEISNLKRT